MFSFIPLFVVVMQSVTHAFDSGAFDCPCVTQADSVFSQMLAKMQALNNNVSENVNGIGIYDRYGLDGCLAYEQTTAICKGPSPPSYCPMRWCYINTDLCPINAALCEAGGRTIGSTGSPYCRDRDTTATKLKGLNGMFRYSYQTCGGVDFWKTSSILDGREMAAAVLNNAPVIYSFKSATGWTGILPTLVEGALQHFSPPGKLNMTGQWATAPSRVAVKKILDTTSSYTACVYDVAVGNFDICLSDFWIFPDRARMATFTVPIATDQWYLVVKPAVVDDTFWDVLARPFQPFKSELWLLIVTFLVVAGIIFAITDADNKEDFPDTEGMWTRILTGMYFSLAGYSCAGPVFNPSSAASRVTNLGVSLFTLIALASYTANLASILVMENSGFVIASIENAILARHSICVPEMFVPQFRARHPLAKFVGLDFETIPRAFHQNACQSFITSLNELNRMHAGHYVTDDCKAYDEGQLTHHEAQCRKDAANGQVDTTRDCVFTRVGDVLMSIPMAMPVSSRLSEATNFGITLEMAQGAMSKLRRKFQIDSVCRERQEETKASELPARSLFGTTFVCGTVMLVGLMMRILQDKLQDKGATLEDNSSSEITNEDLKELMTSLHQKLDKQSGPGHVRNIAPLLQQEACLASASVQKFDKQTDPECDYNITPLLQHQAGSFSEEQIDNTIATYFQRYDFNNSGGIDNEEELYQLVTNLVYSMDLPLAHDDIARILQVAKVTEENPWTVDTFRIWFKIKFCGTC